MSAARIPNSFGRYHESQKRPQNGSGAGYSQENPGGECDSDDQQPPAKKSNFSFRPSQLGKVVDPLWEHSKSEAQKDLDNHVFKDPGLLESAEQAERSNDDSAASGEDSINRKKSYVFGKNIEKRVCSDGKVGAVHCAFCVGDRGTVRFPDPYSTFLPVSPVFDNCFR